MADVVTVSRTLEPALLSPRHGPGVCVDCVNMTAGYERCYACESVGRALSVVAPVSYSVAHEPLHHALATYKRTAGLGAERATRQLAATLWRFLASHEECVAAAAGVESFALVTTVPSSDPGRDEAHPLRRIVGELVAPTRERHERLLTRTGEAARHRRFDPARYAARRPLNGEAVLLIDDTWTTGASAQSAAAALLRAGAGTVAAVVIGRHLNRDWRENDRKLAGLRGPFEWSQCVLCAPATRAGAVAELEARRKAA
jgi:predicted amidophosphoribosyltransferase